MKHRCRCRQILKTVSLLLACALIGGCNVGQAVLVDPVEPSGDAVLQLVNNSSAGELSSPYASEYPSINDTSVFPSESMIQQVAVRFYGENGGEETKAVWISYLDMGALLTNKTETQFRSNISTAFQNVKDFGLNTVIVQVRPFGDALYDSEYFPWSYLITGTEGRSADFDPLAIMVDEAKSKGLRIEAWVNPYRVRAAGNDKALCSDNQARIWLDAGDSAVIQYNGILSYNPASEKARSHIISGIREIVRDYDIDAIHIDDYFYPTTDTAFDQASYTAYQNNGGAMSLGDWRRNNVEKLLKGIYSAIKEENPQVLFGISPTGNISNNYSQQYLDVSKILSTTGYCDYICPQVYWGFEHESQPFGQVVKDWNSLIGTSEIDLYIGIAAYKLGGTDSWAGQGQYEWQGTSTLLRSMVEASRELSGYGGFVLFRYDSLFNPGSSVTAQVNKECGNLKQIL